ncbi:hypothetical protein [Natronorubrum texcoconense]|uniref:Uncharacterized protein n=1 Tax=Natronorubrum texcoconense TaxID=1095776 RepID=A0A1G9H6Q8_9EURY|nr:hypothetical protein [Natronorubrum texcoconense]SDL08444.1 hypothetical protein SAMN04515672_0119 [Natronorubrum texcoconense]
MTEKGEKTGPNTERLELAERRLRVATELVRFTKEVTTLGTIAVLIAL